MIKKKFIVIILAFLINTTVFAQINILDSVYHQLHWRSYKIHIPPAYNGTNPFPLVIALHGGGHDADTMEYISNLSIKADTSNFIVVYPNGTKFFIRTWNAGTCCGNSVTYNIDDVGFIVKMIDTLKANYNIDANRIYLTGASNGGMMAYRLACERADIFAAVAPVATTMVVTDACSPAKTLPLLHIHSLPDTHVPYNGGYGTGFAGFYMPPIDSVIGVWVQNDTCTANFDTVYNANGVLGKRWSDCRSCSEVMIYTTSDGGHSWPGGNKTSAGDTVSTQLNATDLIWNFFSQHSLNCSTSSVEENNSTDIISPIIVYPNPVQNTISIKTELAIKEISIYDILGQKYFTKTFEAQINIPQLPKGIYFLKLTDLSGKMHTQKFIIK